MMRDLATQRYQLELPMDGAYENMDQLLDNHRMSHKPQVWFFIVADCDTKTLKRDQTYVSFSVELEILNNGSHFSEEEAGLTTVFIGALVFVIVFAVTGVYKYISDLANYNNW